VWLLTAGVVALVAGFLIGLLVDWVDGISLYAAGTGMLVGGLWDIETVRRNRRRWREAEMEYEL
jgi:hypothetical protein